MFGVFAAHVTVLREGKLFFSFHLVFFSNVVAVAAVFTYKSQ